MQLGGNVHSRYFHSGVYLPSCPALPALNGSLLSRSMHVPRWLFKVGEVGDGRAEGWNKGACEKEGRLLE